MEKYQISIVESWAPYQIRKIALGCRERFPRYRGLVIPICMRHVRDARAVMHVGIAN